MKAGTKKFDSGLFLRMLSYAKPYKARLYWSVILSIVLAVVAPLRPYLIQFSIDKYVENKLLEQLIYISVVQLALLLLETVLRFIFMFITSWLGQTVVNDLRTQVHKKIIFQNLRYFDNNPIGALTTRTINDVEAINSSFSDGFIAIIADVLTIVALIGIMLYTDWRLTLVSLAVFPVLVLATYWFKESVNASFNRVRTAVAALNAFVQEHISGMYVVQAFAAERKEQEKFRAINHEHRTANIKSIFAYSVFFPIVEIILAVSLGLLVWYGTSQMLNFDVTQGTIIAFNMYLTLLFRPLRMLADKFNTLQMGLIAGGRVMQVLDSDDYMHYNGSYRPPQLKGAVRFEQVQFAYKPEEPVLKNISFEVQPGETIALVGHTGAGKSSIISILTKLYPIQSGTIYIDDVPLDDYDVYALRQHIGIVLQDVFLFSGTIMENLTLRNPNIETSEVEAVCRSLGVHDFIMQLPGAYQHQIKERGSTLSQGQRQLLSFARTLLYNPSILVLDEATSSVDSESEMLIQEAIAKMIQGRTAIVIAHRLSTIRKANKIIVLDKGKIAEQGTHDELVQIPNGLYAALHEASLEKNL